MNISVQSPDLQFLNISNSKFIPSTNKNKNNHHNSNDPRTKNMTNFDLSALSAQLPPNTGPPGTVTVTHGVSSTTTTNKNLSHVPCKFYKQGICQAGNSCPFSHNLDGTLAADKLPCKYFQKGNCKFGLKCALAHILPDGTKVNSKSFLVNSNYHNGNNSTRRLSNNFTNGSNTAIYLNNSTPSSSAQPIDIGHSSLSSGLATSTLSPISNNSVTTYTNVNASNFASQPGSFHNYDTSPFTQSNNVFPNSFNNGIGYSSNNQFSLSNPSNTQIFRSYSTNTSPVNLTTSPQQSKFYTGNSNFIQSPLGANNSYQSTFSSRLPTSQSSISPTNYMNDSAIADGEDGQFDDDSAVFEEDYVPGSLGDLILTPQELQRRDSRSQSGTLLVRPNLNHILSSTPSTKEIEEKEEDNKNEADKPDDGSAYLIDIKNHSKFSSPHEVVFLME